MNDNKNDTLFACITHYKHLVNGGNRWGFSTRVKLFQTEAEAIEFGKDQILSLKLLSDEFFIEGLLLEFEKTKRHDFASCFVEIVETETLTTRKENE